MGKSTLFNQLTRSRDALVADFPGLTRDRKYGEGRSGDREFIVIDTGGLTGDEHGIDAPMANQSMAAMEEADVILLLVDAREGLNGADELMVRPCDVGARHFTWSSTNWMGSMPRSPAVTFTAWVSVTCTALPQARVAVCGP